jgi:predicted phage baseplate assembly protein
MSLEVPELDDRTYAELVAAAVERIPVHTDEWTDHNAHDPGITVLEALAWVAESYGYRLDQVTERHLRKYLSLIGVTPREPMSATVRLRLGEPGSAAGHRLPEGTRLLVEEGATERAFTTTRATTLTAAAVDGVVVEHARGRTDHSSANATDGLHFPAFGDSAAAGSALYVGFDADPFEGPAGAEERVPLDLHLAFHDGDLPTPAGRDAETVEFEPSVELEWEYCTDHEAWWDDANWNGLDVLADGTRSFYCGGTVTLCPPGEDWDVAGAATADVLDRAPGSVWLRCRLAVAGYEVAPRLDGVLTNVLPAAHLEHRAETTLEAVGREETTTTARPGQVFAFDDAPVLDADVVVESAAGERSAWTEVPDLDASGPDDCHYVRDAEAATVRFGDGRRGAVPPAGATVVAERWTVGGGTAGNVVSSARWRLVGVPSNAPDGSLPTTAHDALVDAPLDPLGPSSGGRDAETVIEALGRAREDRRRTDRCVTLADYGTVAAATPGLRVGRTTAWVETGGEDPPDPTVRVVVVPYAHGTGRPSPSEGFLEAVRAYVDRHRLVTDRVRVDPPTYVPVRVEVEVRATSGYAALDLERAVADGIDGFLDPLSGFDGEGWPFGRPLYLSEVYDAVADVPGVDRVLDVDVRVDPTSTSTAPTDDPTPSIDEEGAVTVPADALFDAREHSVTVRTDDEGWSA